MQALTKEQGLFELTLLNSEITQDRFDDLVVDGIDRGIPPELITRLQDLWGYTKVVAGEIVCVGKILVIKIFDFIKANRHLSIGLAVCAALAVLVAGVPFFGPMLAPLVATVAMIYGAAKGTARDSGNGAMGLYDSVHLLAEKFFELLGIIFFSVREYFTTN